ncbi:MAG: ferredoxin [Candidatus Falkowbacteria bacterium]|nr:ferredoxin [Candidatus Falkowbacteria bacterium]
MSIKVNQDTCIGCQTCAMMCPETFEIKDDGKSEPISQEVTECAKNAEAACPVDAISID